MLLITYLGKMVLCSGILLGYYWLFLRNRRFHRYNRFFLLGALVLSMVLPLIRIPVFEAPAGTLNQVAYQTIRAVTLQGPPSPTTVPVQAASAGFTFTLSHAIGLLYGAGILVLLVILGRSLWYIRKLSHQYPYEIIERLKFYRTQEPGTPFSFFRSIFWNAELNLNSREGQQVFRHELFHVEQKHSADILLAEVITIMGWFNPFFYLIKKELKAIHEFLADQYAASGSNRYQYAELLVLQVMNARNYPITHHFFQNHLKRRIAMITQLNQSKYGYWSRLMVLPLSAVLFLSISLYAREKHTHSVNKTAVAFTQADVSRELPTTDTLPAKPREEKKAVKEKVVRDAVIVVEGKPTKNTVKPDEVVVVGRRTPAKTTLQSDEVVVEGRRTPAKTTIQSDEVVVVGRRTPAKTTLQSDEVVVEGRRTPAKTTLQSDEVVVVGRRTPAKTTVQSDEVVVVGRRTPTKATLQSDEVVVMGRPKNQLIQEQELQKHQVVNEVVVEGKPRRSSNFDNAEDTTQITLQRFFNRNFRYPQELMDHDGTGSVWYSFSLDEAGSIRDYEVYNEQPAAAKGMVQEIVIVGFRDASRQPGNPLDTERNQQLLKNEVSRVLAKGVNLFKGRKVTPARYYYKATFKLEK